jgi:hypothetical protein
MIESAEEFVRLRTSTIPEEYRRAAHEAAAEGVWDDVLERFPEMTEWVIHNKTVPLDILRRLSTSPDSRVRWSVAIKRKLDRALFEALAQDEDENVRHAIVWNRKTPPDIVEKLASDSSLFVATAAQEKIALRSTARK